jgi:hypothetical protein
LSQKWNYYSSLNNHNNSTSTAFPSPYISQAAKSIEIIPALPPLPEKIVDDVLMR